MRQVVKFADHYYVFVVITVSEYVTGSVFSEIFLAIDIEFSYKKVALNPYFIHLLCSNPHKIWFIVSI